MGQVEKWVFILESFIIAVVVERISRLECFVARLMANIKNRLECGTGQLHESPKSSDSEPATKTIKNYEHSHRYEHSTVLCVKKSKNDSRFRARSGSNQAGISMNELDNCAWDTGFRSLRLLSNSYRIYSILRRTAT